MMNFEKIIADIDRWIANEQEKNSYSDVCKRCGGTGWYLVKNTNPPYPTVDKEKCSCYDIIANGQALSGSGINESYTFDNFNTHKPFQKNLVTIAKRFVSSPTHWFFVGGQIGSGKTRICKTIVRELINKGMSVVTMNWQDDSTDLKTLSMTSEYRHELDRFKTAKVLYIDDFLKSGNVDQISKADKELAYKIIDYRYNRPELITIFSSEHYFDELLGIDESLSRIEERCTKEFIVNIKKGGENNFRLQ